MGIIIIIIIIRVNRDGRQERLTYPRHQWAGRWRRGRPRVSTNESSCPVQSCVTTAPAERLARRARSHAGWTRSGSCSASARSCVSPTCTLASLPPPSADSWYLHMSRRTLDDIQNDRQSQYNETKTGGKQMYSNSQLKQYKKTWNLNYRHVHYSHTAYSIWVERQNWIHSLQIV